MNKRDRVLALLRKNPNKSARDIAEMANCHITYVHLLRQEMRRLVGAVAASPEAPDVADTINDMLSERGSRYGEFITHAAVTQQIKEVIGKHLYARGKVLKPDQQEALDMIAHKIGRIVNGDPDFFDSWFDIAGYAKLVADRLRGQQG